MRSHLHKKCLLTDEQTEKPKTISPAGTGIITLCLKRCSWPSENRVLPPNMVCLLLAHGQREHYTVRGFSSVKHTVNQNMSAHQPMANPLCPSAQHWNGTHKSFYKYGSKWPVCDCLSTQHNGRLTVADNRRMGKLDPLTQIEPNWGMLCQKPLNLVWDSSNLMHTAKRSQLAHLILEYSRMLIQTEHSATYVYICTTCIYHR